MYVYRENAVVQFGTLAELDLASTGVAGPSWLVMSPILVYRLLATVSTVMSSTVNAVVTFRLRPTFGSASGQSTLGVLKVGTAGGVGAVGGCWYLNINPTAVNPGSQIVTDVTTAATTSGKVVCAFECQENPNTPPNLSTMNSGA